MFGNIILMMKVLHIPPFFLSKKPIAIELLRGEIVFLLQGSFLRKKNSAISFKN